MSGESGRPGWDTGDWSEVPPVTLYPPDPQWTEQYERLSRELARALEGLDVQIEHVGSTAVPGLGARRGIDILIGLSHSADVAACVARLQGIGFQHHFSQPHWTHLSRPGSKLHLTARGSELWTDQLLFRDYLRQHPEAASAYHRLKQELAQQSGSDARQYSEGKTVFVRSMLEKARQERAITER